MTTRPMLEAGQTIYIISGGAIRLEELSDNPKSAEFKLKIGFSTFTECGRRSGNDNIPGIFPATEEYRLKLVALYGAGNVPHLPTIGSQMTHELLSSQVYVLAWVSDKSDAAARRDKRVAVVVNITTCKVYQFRTVTDARWQHAVPIDAYGIEVTEIP